MCISDCMTTICCWFSILFFFFNDTATTEIYTLSLHDALPISEAGRLVGGGAGEVDDACVRLQRPGGVGLGQHLADAVQQDRKSTRLNSSHANISYAVFCLKKKTSPYSYLSIFVLLFTRKTSCA